MLGIHQFLSIGISLLIRFHRSSENAHRKANQESDRKTKSDFKSGTSRDKIIYKAKLNFERKNLIKQYIPNKFDSLLLLLPVGLCTQLMLTRKAH